jgi:hypothetical protein
LSDLLLSRWDAGTTPHAWSFEQSCMQGGCIRHKVC